MKRSHHFRRWVAVFLLAMAIVHIVVLYQDRDFMASGYGDFSAFYTAGLMMRQGMSHQLYNSREQWQLQREFAPAVKIRQGPMPYVRPPFEALLFLPLSYFSYPTALAVWSALKIGFLFLSLRILLRAGGLAREYSPGILLLLSLGVFPVFLDLYQGQDTLLLLLLIALAFRGLCLQKDAGAGAFLALGLFKFHLILPFVIMLSIAGRPRILRGFLPVALSLVAISVSIGGFGVLLSYPAYLAALNRAAGAGMVTAQSMPNLRGLLTGWVGRAPYPGPIHWLLLPVAVSACALTVWIWRRAERTGADQLAIGYSLSLAVTILTSYYAYSYDLALLLLPVLILAGRLHETPQFSRADRVISCGLLLWLCSPLYWILILRLDQPYLLAIPVLVLAFGTAAVLRKLASHPEPSRFCVES